MEQRVLLEGEAAEVVEARRAERQAQRASEVGCAPARVVRANRRQVELRAQDLEGLIASGHRARSVWAVVERLDLEGFYQAIKARGSEAGRPASDPKVLVALWLYATSEGVGCARELARLCEEHNAYRWLRGGVPVNYHTLSDFRVGHEQELDDLFTQVLAVMMGQGLVSLRRVAQDGTRVRASAGGSTFRRRERLENLREVAREQVASVKMRAEGGGERRERRARQQAAQERAARERAERVEQALVELGRIEEQRKQQTGGKKSKGEPRASTTDPQARVMKMGDKGFRPAYNAQLATDTHSRVIVGVAITEQGTDYAQCAPMIEQVERRAGRKPQQMVVDGGFASKEVVEAAANREVQLYAPLPERKGKADPHEIKPSDSAAVREWKERMAGEEAKKIGVERGATAELVNGDLKTWRTLGRFTVRGKSKVLSVLLWNALAYNLLRWLALAPGA